MDSISGGVCFRILGPLEAIVDGRAVVFDRPQHRDLLGLFLLQPNRLITVEQVIEAMWGPAPPKTATAQVHNMVSALRSALRREPKATPIVRRRSGYLLPLDDEGCVDAGLFERMTAAGRWRAALELWRGDPLADAQAPYAATARPALREKRLLALEALFEVELEQGRHAAAVPELTAAVADSPLREGLVGQLMTALYRCGRQTEALRVFRETRTRLAEEHGLDPGPALRELERLVLKASPDLDPPPQTTADPLAGAKLAVYPHRTVNPPAERLGDGRQRLDAAQAGIGVSYAAQSEDRRRALRVLSVLGPAGGDAWLLASVLGIGEEAAFDLCEELVAAHLLEPAGGTPTGYRMHDLIRDYARERFDADEPKGAGAAIAATAAETFLMVAVEAERSLGWQGVHPCGRLLSGYPIEIEQSRRMLPHDVDPAAWLSQHRAALVAVSTRAHAESLWAHTFSLARAAAPALEAGGHFDEWLEVAGLGLDAAERAGEPDWVASIHAGLGTLHFYRHDFARSRESLERALAVWSGQSSRPQAAYAELVLAMTNRAMGEAGTAILLESALDAGAAAGDVVLEVEALRCLAWVDRDGGLPEQACARLRRAADLLSDLDEKSDRLRGYVLHDLGVMVNDLEDHPAAVAILERALGLFTRLGDRHWRALTLNRLGDAAEAAGRHTGAIERFLAALEVFRAMHDPKGEGQVLLRLGCLHTTTGDYVRAQEFLDRAAAIHHRASQGLDHAYVQVALGELYELQGDYARALEAFGRALRKLDPARGNRWEQRARAGVERLNTRRIAPEWVLGEPETAG